MAERVKIPGVLGISDSISEAVIDALINDGKLPSDFDFRLLSILDSAQRQEIAQADIMAALGFGVSSGAAYLTDPLQDCVLVSGFAEIRPILMQLEDDYHSSADLLRIAEAEGIRWHEARNAWDSYLNYFNPALALSLRGLYAHKGRADPGLSKEYQYRRALSRVVIRDEALYGFYLSGEKMPGHGPTKQKMLRYLLLDNHPELGIK